jgi:hypothetical protein
LQHRSGENSIRGGAVPPEPKERKMEVVTVILQIVGVAVVAYGLVLAAGNGLGHALVDRRKNGHAAA